MKTNWIKRTLVAGLALLGLMAGQAVYAQANSATVTVNAVVPKACRFYLSGAATLTINIDPTDLTGPATGNTALNYRCQNGLSPQFDLDTGSGYSGTLAVTKTGTLTLVGPAAATMDVNLSVTGDATPGSGLGNLPANDRSAVISGDIVVGQYGGAAPGTYTNTVDVWIEAQ